MKRLALAVFGALILWPCAVAAHDVPDDVRIRIFLEPEGNRMLILVRIPASALIDILFPMRPDSDWLDLNRIDGYAMEGAKVWVADLLSVYEGDTPMPKPQVLAVRISRLENSSFDTYQGASEHVVGDRLPPDTLLSQDQAAVDALLVAPIHSALSDFAFEPRFARVGVRVTTTLTFLPLQGGIRQFEYEGDPETFHLDPNWSQAVTRLMQAGFAHYFDQTDYLLFLFCVVLVFDKFRVLASFTTAFAAAQFFALVGFAFGIAPPDQWIPLWGVLIAAATVYMGIEAIVAESADDKRFGLAVGIGLLFGWGFCFALRPVVQYGGAHRVAAVLAFDASTVACYLSAVLLVFVVAKSLSRFSSAPRVTSIIAAAVALRISWHRMLDRAHALTFAPMTFPAINLAIFSLAALIAIATISGWAYRSLRVSSPPQ